MNESRAARYPSERRVAMRGNNSLDRSRMSYDCVTDKRRAKASCLSKVTPARPLLVLLTHKHREQTISAVLATEQESWWMSRIREMSCKDLKSMVRISALEQQLVGEQTKMKMLEEKLRADMLLHGKKRLPELTWLYRSAGLQAEENKSFDMTQVLKMQEDRHKQEMKRLREESQGRVACLKASLRSLRASKLREVKASNESMQQEIERLKGLELEVEQQTSRGDGLEEDKTRLNGRLEEMEREMESRRQIETQQGEQIARALHDLNLCRQQVEDLRSSSLLHVIPHTACLAGRDARVKLRVCKEQKLEEAEEAMKEVEQKLQTSESMREVNVEELEKARQDNQVLQQKNEILSNVLESLQEDMRGLQVEYAEMREGKAASDGKIVELIRQFEQEKDEYAEAMEERLKVTCKEA
ncbi:hypothetical protein GUITHDRAFT_117940 [Guillardia theta CCMP2712]|uniref:Uncharacterized protein n=1 Tax=Guillardia theta (strain CCMP2712) TaxID=905079 RepID=L1IIJ5_GUITC|nr:hypothetical protein GUITHDRAFT_117940 [Guillardia theta CCMP2712]EKX35907.1 hypothetical protein GUITHDRAFT_117940 [Guillardia theta CCMP2712]|eukprot:XP_005822887.1 hypothetical protein GUITHDRAFT_117940 [Guillardia theta CCMP2712]